MDKGTGIDCNAFILYARMSALTSIKEVFFSLDSNQALRHMESENSGKNFNDSGRISWEKREKERGRERGRKGRRESEKEKEKEKERERERERARERERESEKEKEKEKENE